jgi:hypothetical protein
VLYFSAAPWFIVSVGQSRVAYLSVAALVTVITGILHYVLDYRVRWKEHELAVTRYSALNRRIERVIATRNFNEDILLEIENALNGASETCPTPSWLLWNRPKEISEKARQLAIETSADASASN